MSGYAEYREANLPWLKAVPAHWEIRRNKNIFTEQKEIVGERSADYTLLSLTLNGIIPRDMDGGGKFPESFDKYKIVKNGDMAFCLFDIDETPRTVGLSGYNGMLTGAYTIMRVSNINARFIYYYYLALDNGKMLRPLYTGLRKTININTFQSTKVPVPPREEQDQIVRFLDWKVSGINRLIAIKKQRRALIFDLIQLHLFSDDVSQSSIGRIEAAFPEHWKSIKARCIFSERIEKGHTEDELLAVTQDKGVVFKKDCDSHYVQPSNFESQKLVYPGDFIISLRSFQGGIEHSRIKGLVSAAYTVMELNPSYSRIEEYYGFLFKSKPFIQYLNSCVNDIRDGKKIGYKDFRDCPLPIPPVRTLEKINILRKEYDKATEELNRCTSLLHELRTRLISDVVTGKIDVRSIEIPEYEFVDEDNDNVDENLEQGADEPPEEE
ncbi:restriction endonuclease subunit S [Vescimonas sanitatis]|uniref:restriction endonuclease subunit S n=1 Tax=Vescimonas sanitatis TaxID=3376993 RepID=UPI003B7FA2B3